MEARLRKRTLLIPITLFSFCFFLLAGCAAGPVDKDLVNYINQNIMGIAIVEQSALDQYAAVSGAHYQSDDQLFRVLKEEVVPTYVQLVDVLHQMEPETREVKELHAHYVNGSDYRRRGFETMLNGIRLQDPYLIQAANRLLAMGEHEIEVWRQSLQKLYTQYKIRR